MSDERQPDAEFPRGAQLWCLLPHEPLPEGARIIYRVALRIPDNDDTDHTYHTAAGEGLSSLFGDRGPVVVADWGPDIYTLPSTGSAGPGGCDGGDS